MAVLFVLAGIAAVFSPVGLIFAIVMSVIEGIWILWAGIALLVSSRRVQPATVPGLAR